MVSDSSDRQHYCSRCLTTFSADESQCPNLACRRKKPSRGWGVIFSEGDVFDRTYNIHKMLAVGGAGVTYLARELDGAGEETGPRVAIKVLLAARDQGPYVRRLATEAQIIQELDHPNIVQYLGFVHRAGHSPYLLTRFEAGGSLLDHMRRVGTLSVRQTALVGRQICWALEKGHERGIVHRDLKPENVLLTRAVPLGDDPVVRVADFGIAKVRGGLGSNLTRVGAFVGTPHYAAPEQFVGGSVTEAADVYATGALLYFTMTARHVVKFADRLDPEDGFQLLCDSLPPKIVRPDDDAEDIRRMDAVLAVAMEVDPLKRCSVVELDRMLEQVAAGQDPVVPIRERPSPTDEDSFLSGDDISNIGVAGAMSDLAALADAPSPVEAKPTEQMLAGVADTVADESTEDIKVAALTADTVQSQPTVVPKKKRRRRWGLMLGFVFLLGSGGIGVIIGLGALLYFNPDVISSVVSVLGMGGSIKDGRPLRAKGASAEDLKDLEAIERSFETRESWLQKQCEIPKGTTMKVKLVIDGDGQVQAVKAAGAAAALHQCVEEHIVLAKFTRAGSDLVRVQHTARW